LDAGLLTWHLRWQGFLLRTKRDLGVFTSRKVGEKLL
jgi:hypothetical protein